MNHAGKRIPNIVDVADAARFVRKEKSRFSVGGMVTKLEAVRLAIAAGIPTVIANGRRARAIPRIVAGRGGGTPFSVRAAQADATTLLVAAVGKWGGYASTLVVS